MLNKKQIEFCKNFDKQQGPGNMPISNGFMKMYERLKNKMNPELEEELKNSNSCQWWFYEKMQELEKENN